MLFRSLGRQRPARTGLWRRSASAAPHPGRAADDGRTGGLRRPFHPPELQRRAERIAGPDGSLPLGCWRTGHLEPDRQGGGTGQLRIAGQLNPVGRPLALDLQAQATDLELTPLSPYAAKYAGHAIQRGKLGMDVHYQIGVDGQLQARNQEIGRAHV